MSVQPDGDEPVAQAFQVLGHGAEAAGLGVQRAMLVEPAVADDDEPLMHIAAGTVAE